MSEVKNTKNQAAQAEDILREPSGAQKDSGTGGKKEDCDRNIRYRGNVYQETAIPMTYGMIRGWGRYMTIISIMPWYIHRMV